MRKEKNKLITVFLGLFFVSAFFNFYAIAEEKIASTDSPVGSLDYESRADCFEKFDMERVLSNENTFLKTRVNKFAFQNYFRCRAAAMNNVDECNPLKEERGKCIDNYNSTIGFWSRLIFTRNITPELLNNCSYVKGNRNACKEIAKAFLKKDESVCRSNDDDCKALMKLDPNLTNSQLSKDTINFIKAIQSSDLNYCLKIRDPDFKMQCQAYTSHDENICRKGRDFKRIRLQYCSEYK